MSSWRCPHCAAAQPETARCWVCRRSTTCCATCRHFRRGVASDLGYCGLDKRRVPLLGDEMRACWAGSVGPLLAETEPFTVPVTAAARERPVLAFVEVPTGRSGHGTRAVQDPPPGPVERPPDRSPEPPAVTGWTLWGDAFL